MINDKTGLFVREERPRDNWVIGLAIDEHSKGYYFRALTREGVVNDSVGPFPVTLYADAETRNIHAYLRQMGDRVMTLKLDDRGENLVDPETGAAWSLARGLPQNEAAQGETLLMVPYLSSFDWAWLDFHPDSEFYE